MKTVETPRGMVIIRQARPEDVQAYRMLRLEALKNHPEAFTSDYETSLAWPVERWLERLGPGTGSIEKATFLAEAGDQVAAMGGIFRGDSPKTAHTGTVVGIYARPEWRGCGLGEALVLSCEEWAREKGMRILKLAVMSGNVKAIQIYSRCGFRVYGIDPHSVFTGGQYYDEILMTKELD